MSSPFSLRYALLGSFLLSFACGGPEPIGEGHLEVGTGEWQFEDFEDGDSIELVRGSQGGHHVWISFRSDNMHTGNAKLSIETRLADDSLEPQRSSIPLALQPSSDGDGRSEFLGWPAVIARPGCFANKLVRMTVSVSDAQGRLGTVDRYLIPTGENIPSCPFEQQ